MCVLPPATPNQDHTARALAGLESGKQFFVEKPMALTRAECEALRAAVAKPGLQLTVGFNRRFAPFYIELKRRLQGRTGPAVLNCRVKSPGISGTYWMADPRDGRAILCRACPLLGLPYLRLGARHPRGPGFFLSP